MTDVQLVRRATGLLAAFNEAGVLAAADVHVATRLARLGGESDDRVLLAAALAVRALRGGSVCLDLATARATTAVEDVAAEELDALAWPDPDAWAAALAASPLVAVGPTATRRCRCGWPAARSTSTATGGRSSGSREVLDEAALRPLPAVDARRLGAALARLFPAPAPTGSGWRPRSPRTAGSACWPAGRAPARPPRSPSCWPCSRTRATARCGWRWPRPRRSRPAG